MSIDWISSENDFWMNPRLSEPERAPLDKFRLEGGSLLSGHVFVLTSGTTGKPPRWVALAKTALLCSAAAVNEHLEAHSEDIWLHCLPEFHVGGIGIRARAWLNRAKVVRFESEKWSAPLFGDAVDQNRATLCSLVPAQVHDLVQLKRVAPRSLRAILVGGDALAPTLYLKARELGWNLLPTYGMSEACSQIATAPLGSLRSMDWPRLRVLPHLEVRTTDSGAIAVRGASLLTGYLEKGLVDPKDSAGWLVTQDLGRIDGSWLEILGRSSDRIKIGGELSDLARLRRTLAELKAELGVEGDLAIQPREDERLGQVIELLTTTPPSSPQIQGLLAELEKRVAPFERPRYITFVEEISRTALGKLPAPAPKAETGRPAPSSRS